MVIEQLVSFSPEITDAIRQLAQKIGPNYKPLTDKDMQSIIDSPNTFIFLAKEKEKVVGMITLLVYRIPYIKKAGIEDFVVDEEYRGHGIGSKLLQIALEHAQKEGAAYVDFTSRPIRIESNSLYEKLGFKRRDTNVYRFVYDK